MAFAQIEDLQGSIELVIFPRVWAETRSLWEPDRILVVRGTVSLKGREPSILVDSATNEITVARPLDEAPEPSPPPPGRLHLYITVAAQANQDQLVRRLGQVYDKLLQHRGSDRFSLLVDDGRQGRRQVDFPNDTTRYCVALEQDLRALLGGGAIRVEPQ
jgi:DNA polymerase III alpha subunit